MYGEEETTGTGDAMALIQELHELQAENAHLHDGTRQREPPQDIQSEISALRREVEKVTFELRQYCGNQKHPDGIPMFPLDEIDAGTASNLEKYHEEIADQERNVRAKADVISKQEHDIQIGLREVHDRMEDLERRNEQQLDFRRRRDEEVAKCDRYKEEILDVERHLMMEHNDLIDNFDAVVSQHINGTMKGKDTQIKDQIQKLFQQKVQLERLAKDTTKADKRIDRLTKTQEQNALEIKEKDEKIEELTAQLAEVRDHIADRELQIEKHLESMELHRMRLEEEDCHRRLGDHKQFHLDVARRRDEDEKMHRAVEHLFATPEEGIEFRVQGMQTTPPHDTNYRWSDDGSGLILDVHGIHLYSRPQNAAFTIPYGGMVGWVASPYEGECGWGKTPKKKVLETEAGQLTLFVRSKPHGHADAVIVVLSEAAKSIHNYFCVLHGVQDNMVTTRTKEEMMTANKKNRRLNRKTRVMSFHLKR